LGVINLTPNSFSDGGKHLDQTELRNTILKFQTFKNLIIDLGFESTAPMNQAISVQDERIRMNFFFDFLKKFPEIKFDTISVDTYKLENFVYFYNEIKKLNPEIRLILNDISGVLDLALEKVLTELDDVTYIFTATRIPDRSLVLDHMKFLTPSHDNIISESLARFIYASKWFTERKIISRVIFDPGFGFSKTYDENWMLIDKFDILNSKLLENNIELPWVIGISKKSFLRKKCESENNISKISIEELHKNLILKFMSDTKNIIYFRVHDPDIIPAKLPLHGETL
jgi:dihydropteroate synthase